MTNTVEILANIMLVLGLAVFVGGCFWTMYTLDKDDKKPKHKIKKA